MPSMTIQFTQRYVRDVRWFDGYVCTTGALSAHDKTPERDITPALGITRIKAVIGLIIRTER
jgi:hypothetical protein